MLKLVVFCVCVIVFVTAHGDGEKGKRHHRHEWFTKFLATLPEDQRKQVEEIKSSTPDRKERREKLHKFFESLPADKRPHFPQPKFVEKLPADIQAKIKAVHEDRSIQFRDRFKKIREILDSLPEDLKKLVPQRGPFKQ
ncbi:unnamed protein product, partial [Mesorhabditis belari]|uniref:Uncharacterized protein n=1 Tax=Mesorhabditis belari TaxID=2138241 RepID=A0AAF3FG90_9BILA